MTQRPLCARWGTGPCIRPGWDRQPGYLPDDNVALARVLQGRLGQLTRRGSGQRGVLMIPEAQPGPHGSPTPSSQTWCQFTRWGR